MSISHTSRLIMSSCHTVYSVLFFIMLFSIMLFFIISFFIISFFMMLFFIMLFFIIHDSYSLEIQICKISLLMSLQKYHVNSVSFFMLLLVSLRYYQSTSSLLLASL